MQARRWGSMNSNESEGRNCSRLKEPNIERKSETWRLQNLPFILDDDVLSGSRPLTWSNNIFNMTPHVQPCNELATPRLINLLKSLLSGLLVIIALLLRKPT